jgi:hypothetical protein
MFHMGDGVAYDNASTWKVVFNQAILYVRRVKVDPAVELGHAKGLRAKNAIYPYTIGKCLTYSIPNGTSSYMKENLFSNAQLPKFVIVGLVPSDAYNGSYTSKPFEFKHFGTTNIALYQDGQSVPFKREYVSDFAKGLCTDTYFRSMVVNTQMMNTNRTHGIDIADYKKKYTFFTFNLCADFEMNQVQKVRESNLRLEMRFKNALTSAINVIVYGVFDATLQITFGKQVIKDEHV